MITQQSSVFQKSERLYHESLIPEIYDGNIKSIDISRLSDEELKKMCYHFSLKKDQPFIDKNGLVPKIGRNSKGLDTQRLIFFSYGIQGVIELWDFWLKWRANKLFNPWYQEEDKKTISAFRKGNISLEEQNKFFEKYGIRKIKNGSWEGLISRWEEDFISGVYKEDEELRRILFEYQIDELIASNYYLLDLIEGKDYSFDEIDLKKQKMLSWDPNSTDYRVYSKMLEGHSDLNSIKVDNWNMTTKIGNNITIAPEKIKQISLAGTSSDALMVLLYLYDRYKKITPENQQVKTELLDCFVKYVCFKIRNNELQNFDRTPEIRMNALSAYFHNQKSNTYKKPFARYNAYGNNPIVCKTQYFHEMIAGSKKMKSAQSLDD